MTLTQLIYKLLRNSTTSDEIERKFLVAALPSNLHKHPYRLIGQGYLLVPTSYVPFFEVRLRYETQNGKTKYCATSKKGSGLLREECIMPLPKSVFDFFWPLTKGARIFKKRYSVPLGEYTADLDLFAARHGCTLVEVEFPTVKASQLFIPPLWFGKEITNDPYYKNRNIATR